MIFTKLLAVILLWFVALQVWDIATLQMLSVIRSLVGVLRFLGGCAAGFAALVLLYFWIPVAPGTFSTLAIATFVAALIAEFLVGDDVRRAFRAGFRGSAR